MIEVTSHIFLLYAIRITNIHHKFGILFTGFNIFAQYVENSKVLKYEGYRYHKNRERKTCTHYVCSGHNRFKCRAKVCTKMIKGDDGTSYEMMKVKYNTHTHPPDQTLLN